MIVYYILYTCIRVYSCTFRTYTQEFCLFNAIFHKDSDILTVVDINNLGDESEDEEDYYYEEEAEVRAHACLYIQTLICICIFLSTSCREYE